jgi:hypothetical protein
MEEDRALPLALARRVRAQQHRQHGRKVYSLHGPEVSAAWSPPSQRLAMISSATHSQSG